jgi:hypothetical protein
MLGSIAFVRNELEEAERAFRVVDLESMSSEPASGRIAITMRAKRRYSLDHRSPRSDLHTDAEADRAFFRVVLELRSLMLETGG